MCFNRIGIVTIPGKRVCISNRHTSSDIRIETWLFAILLVSGVMEMFSLGGHK